MLQVRMRAPTWPYPSPSHPDSLVLVPLWSLGSTLAWAQLCDLWKGVWIAAGLLSHRAFQASHRGNLGEVHGDEQRPWPVVTRALLETVWAELLEEPEALARPTSPLQPPEGP